MHMKFEYFLCANKSHKLYLILGSHNVELGRRCVTNLEQLRQLTARDERKLEFGIHYV